MSTTTFTDTERLRIEKIWSAHYLRRVRRLEARVRALTAEREELRKLAGVVR